MEYEGQKDSLTSEELDRIFTRISGKLIPWCIIALVYGAVRLIKLGAVEWQGLTMILGSVLAWTHF